MGGGGTPQRFDEAMCHAPGVFRVRHVIRRAALADRASEEAPRARCAEQRTDAHRLGALGYVHLGRVFEDGFEECTNIGVRDQIAASLDAGNKTPIVVPSSAAGNQFKALEVVFATFE